MSNHGKQQTGLDADSLLQAIHDQQDPPCDRCAFSHECHNPEACTPYQIYVETGKAVRPPRQLPKEDKQQ